MTDETPKPKRKRWRWIIAGVLLFVVAVFGWWMWPLADQRFVGNWAVLNDHQLIGDRIEFHPEGSCERYRNGVKHASYIRWWVDGGEIVLVQYPANSSQIMKSLPALIQKVAGGRRETDLRLNVSKLSEDEFEFQLNAYRASHQTARRIRE